jgi:hypothetical protein
MYLAHNFLYAWYQVQYTTYTGVGSDASLDVVAFVLQEACSFVRVFFTLCDL